MNLRLLASAAAASLLAAGVAHAQPGSSASPDTGVAPSQATPVPPQSATTGLPAPDSASTTTTTTTTTGTDVTASTTTAPSAAAAGSNASFTTKVLTNGPVPDTPENRQKYGGPMSRAGKHTAPRGN